MEALGLWLLVMLLVPIAGVVLVVALIKYLIRYNHEVKEKSRRSRDEIERMKIQDL